MRKRSWILAGLGAVALIGAGLWMARGPIAVNLMGRVYDRALSTDPIAALPDGLHVGLCGTGSPLPDPTRAGPCTVVIAGRHEFVVDSGEGSVKQMTLMNLPPAQLEAAFLTHFHSDHIGDLGELMLQRWTAGSNTTPLPVYGPAGVEAVVNGLNAAYRLDQGYRIAHHGPAVAPPTGAGGTPRPFALSETADTLVYSAPDLQVFAFPVDHGPVKPAVGYRFVYKGRSVVISGDTAPSPRLEAASKDVDLLVHEGLAPNLVAVLHDRAAAHGKTHLAQIFHDILSYHTPPEAAAGIAERAHARMLLFTHVIPPMPMEALEGPFLGKSRQIYRGRLKVGRDGDFVTLPAGSKDIRVSNRMRTLI
jgi:ribonuclease Z